MADVVTLTKAKIKPAGKSKFKEFSVLFNPTEYSLERSVNYAEHSVLGLNSPILQFVSGTSDTLNMELFFDTYSAGSEAGDKSVGNTLKGTSNQPESKKKDVRFYTHKVYSLLDVEGSTHAPPRVCFEWGSLKFEGYVVSVSQVFTKFTYKGIPVRARVNVSFRSCLSTAAQLRKAPRNSPDRTKYRRMSEGDTLSALAWDEYQDPELWREIARANDIDNPRLIRSGSVLRVPALRE